MKYLVKSLFSLALLPLNLSSIRFKGVCLKNMIFALLLSHTSLIYAETVYFYNSDSNIDNFATLKSQFDTYLAQQGNFTLQPFSDRNSFEQAISNNPSGLYLLSGWHYTQLSNKLALQAILVGSQKGESLQRKVLTSQDISDIEALRGITIAGAGSTDYLRNLLKQMLGNDKDSLINSMQLLSVPKDIDALMAVSFGIAKASISSESSLNKLALINAAQRAKLKTLASSEKHFLLIAAITKKRETEPKNLVQILEEMGKQAEGENSLKMLGLDGWKKTTDLDSSLAKQLR